MKEFNVFIGDKEMLYVVIRSLHLNINSEVEEHLVNKLYPHIEHTRRTQFKNGYDQGRFDEKMDRY